MTNRSSNHVARGSIYPDFGLILSRGESSVSALNLRHLPRHPNQVLNLQERSVSPLQRFLCETRAEQVGRVNQLFDVALTSVAHLESTVRFKSKYTEDYDRASQVK